jgi:uncharacterized membrane protein YedE/YeeE
MSDQAVVAIGGLLCGLAAGAAAQYGRLCTFAAIEDALLASDFRRARAWALALGVAMAATQAMVAAGLIDPLSSFHSAGRLELASLIAGAVLFGVGMALIGTCGFGLLVRGGSGDLRAMLMAVVLGIAAFAATAGALAVPRVWIATFGAVGLGPGASGTLTGLTEGWLGPSASTALALLLAGALAAFALSCAKFRRRSRLLIAAPLLGASIAGGWIVTGVLADPFGAHRLESLTFVAPIGRLLLVIMGESLAQAGFAVTSVVGVVGGSFLVAAARRELRWEAFDDQREMRRHIMGAILMGIGGVMARGCTIGQGLTAFSLTAVTAPVAILGMVVGARIGLAYLMAPASWTPARRPWARRGSPTE